MHNGTSSPCGVAWSQTNLLKVSIPTDTHLNFETQHRNPLAPVKPNGTLPQLTLLSYPNSQRDLASESTSHRSCFVIFFLLGFARAASSTYHCMDQNLLKQSRDSMKLHKGKKNYGISDSDSTLMKLHIFGLRKETSSRIIH